MLWWVIACMLSRHIDGLISRITISTGTNVVMAEIMLYGPCSPIHWPCWFCLVSWLWGSTQSLHQTSGEKQDGLLLNKSKDHGWRKKPESDWISTWQYWLLSSKNVCSKVTFGFKATKPCSCSSTRIRSMSSRDQVKRHISVLLPITPVVYAKLNIKVLTQLCIYNTFNRTEHVTLQDQPNIKMYLNIRDLSTLIYWYTYFQF